ncbi:MAG TPA: DUF3224 domain-containing protein [Verrucomicrobiae bacterium]|nr:DUF3224 domain-containing protein [Verrucomicrobiae bacterium]
MNQHHGEGTFEVKVTPVESAAIAGEPELSSMAIVKEFHGALEAASKGLMLGAGAPMKGSAGYVAIEKVAGTLGGRAGSFVLQHSGTMHRGMLELSVTVVPGSGTGELSGLAGKMSIEIAAGKHFYTFDYTLESPS